MKKTITMAALAIATGSALTTRAAVSVLVSGQTDGSKNQEIVSFIEGNFADVTVTLGDYSDTSNTAVQDAINAADVFIIGRDLSSTPYTLDDNAFYDGLTIPMVSLTTYTTRTGSGSQGLRWEGGSASGGALRTGSESTVTADGAALFGAAGNYDWWDGDLDFWATGTGSVGDGSILATMGGDHLVVGWDAGDLNGAGNTFSGSRLLFNLPQDSSRSAVPDTIAGEQAFADALTAYTGMAQIPEPATIGMMALMGGAILFIRRRITM